MIRALTLHQPWAWAMARGDKRIETRSWPLSHRGDLAIHAAQGLPDYAALFIRDNRDLYVEDERTMVYAAVVAVVRVVACVPLWNVGEGDTVGGIEMTDLELRWGNYSSVLGQRYGFVTEDLRPLPAPVACRGRQGIWFLDGPAEEAVRTQVRVERVGLF
jgi:ASCH domain-containing protein